MDIGYAINQLGGKPVDGINQSRMRIGDSPAFCGEILRCDPASGGILLTTSTHPTIDEVEQDVERWIYKLADK